MEGQTVPPELRELADEIGNFIQFWGFKRIHGRIWTHLCVAKEPLDASDLIDRLAVSKALISMTLTDLLEYQVIEEAGRSDRGTILYRINPDVLGVIRDVLRTRERQLLGRIAQAHRKASAANRSGKKSMNLDTDRLRGLGKLIRGACRALDGYLLRQRFDLSLSKRFSIE